MNTPSAKEIIHFAADKYVGQLNIGADNRLITYRNDLIFYEKVNQHSIVHMKQLQLIRANVLLKLK
jgi:hypothetical protein